MKMTQEEKTARSEARKAARKAAKENLKIETEKNQKPVKEMTITIEWTKSRTWGSNPHASAKINFMDGSFIRSEGYTASGCGYDKESTVIGEIFNNFMKYKLWQIPYEVIANSRPTNIENPAPYGIHAYLVNSRSYGQGIGTNCYYDIAKYIGGKFEHISSGKTFDVYKYTDGKEATT